MSNISKRRWLAYLTFPCSASTFAGGSCCSISAKKKKKFPCNSKRFFSPVTVFQHVRSGGNAAARTLLPPVNTGSEAVRWFWLCAPTLSRLSTCFRNPPGWLHQRVQHFFREPRHSRFKLKALLAFNSGVKHVKETVVGIFPSLLN